MKINQIISETKVTAKPAPKPRNFVAKNAIQSGAGAHKDKKKAAKQGEVKHKGQVVAEYGDTAKGQKMLTKVQKRAVDRVTSKKADTDPAYAKKNKETADRAWDRMSEEFHPNNPYYEIQSQGQQAGMAGKPNNNPYGEADDSKEAYYWNEGYELGLQIRRQRQGVAEARANTNAVRTGLAKREKRADPTMDAKKKSEQDAAWERLQAHMNKPENMAVMKRLATEGAEFGAYYYEQLAQKVFDENPNLNTSGRADELLNAAFPIAVQDLGKKRAQWEFGYDEDFPSDFVSAYAWLQKQGQTEGFDSTVSSIKTAASNVANKVGDTLANALPKEMRPLDNQTAANSVGYKGKIKEATNPDLMSQTDYDRYQQDQMDYNKRAFKRDELEHELGHEDRGMYWVMVAKNGKWEYTKAQPKQQGMNPAMRLISALHAKYPGMHLGMQWPNGQVENYGKGKK